MIYEFNLFLPNKLCTTCIENYLLTVLITLTHCGHLNLF